MDYAFCLIEHFWCRTRDEQMKTRSNDGRNKPEISYLILWCLSSIHKIDLFSFPGLISVYYDPSHLVWTNLVMYTDYGSLLQRPSFVDSFNCKVKALWVGWVIITFEQGYHEDEISELVPQSRQLAHGYSSLDGSNGIHSQQTKLSSWRFIYCYTRYSFLHAIIFFPSEVTSI